MKRDVYKVRHLAAVCVLAGPIGLVGLVGSCDGGATQVPDAGVVFVEQREPCAARDPERRVFFGDLHVHTTNSFDAHAFDVRTTPAQAYGFAKGEAVALPPLDANGQGTTMLRLDRPLDFAAVTDHSEFLGEVEACITPGSDSYDLPECAKYRMGGNNAIINLGFRLTLGLPSHDPAICGDDGARCVGPAGAVWRRIQEAAEGAYDRTAACRFTSLIAYEYSAAPQYSTMHRNVIFKNERVPSPISLFDQPTPEELWAALASQCTNAGTGCEVLAIPHNPNESNGRMFFVENAGEEPVESQRKRAIARAAIEPVVEVYQHKGDSECMNGLSGVMGAPDELCGFEKSPRDPFKDCGETVGAGGITRKGCYSSRDFLRGALLKGLSEADRIGANPFRLGVIASTDTHNGTPGAVDEHAFVGHRGTDDDTPERQLGTGSLTPGGIQFSPGGLAAVWAEENSRAAIFEAIRRREVYGTSGPRIAVRFFGGFALPSSLCSDPTLVKKGYASGVPMGGVLGPVAQDESTGPTFVVSALRDPGTSARPGRTLQRIQIVKGWLQEGVAWQKVFNVAGDVNDGAGVNTATCMPTGKGADSLCATWTDPEFRASDRAFYYARVIEDPTCRWSTIRCNELAPEMRPPSCTDPSLPKMIQERVWTSPIWYDPDGAK